MHWKAECLTCYFVAELRDSTANKIILFRQGVRYKLLLRSALRPPTTSLVWPNGFFRPLIGSAVFPAESRGVARRRGLSPRNRSNSRRKGTAPSLAYLLIIRLFTALATRRLLCRQSLRREDNKFLKSPSPRYHSFLCVVDKYINCVFSVIFLD